MRTWQSRAQVLPRSIHICATRSLKRGKDSQETYVGISRFSEATEVGHISLRLVSRWRWATAAGGGLGNRRRRSLRRSHSRVCRRGTKSSLGLVGGRHSGSTHVGRTLLETELKTVGPTGGATTVGHVAGGTARGDGHRWLARVIAGGSSRSSGSSIDNGHARRGRLLRLILHGFAVHRYGARLPMLR